MPRMLRRAAVLGATAHVASQRGQARGEAEADQQYAAEAATAQDPYGDLMKLKELLDAGALTQEEFDAQKQKILA